jgi:hypothetical protein
MLGAIESNLGHSYLAAGRHLTNNHLEEGLIPTTYSDRKIKKREASRFALSENSLYLTTFLEFAYVN